MAETSATPAVDRIGASPENTPPKQLRLRKVAGMVLGAASRILVKHSTWAHDEILIVDLTAGPGVLSDRNGAEYVGSPLILLDLVRGLRTPTPYRAVFLEREEDRCAELRSRVSGDRQVSVICGDHTEAAMVDRVLAQTAGCVRRGRKAFGLIYVDCDGGGRIPWQTINRLRSQPELARMETLVHVSANNAYKRKREQQPELLVEDVAHLTGKHLAVWAGETGQQWVLVYLTDFEDIAGPRLEDIGFVSGQAAWDRVIERSFTAEDAAYLERIHSGQQQFPLASAYRNYEEYLRHPYFRVVRAIAMRRAEWTCLRCGAPATQVHHLRYPPWGTFDVPENLEPICQSCHAVEHGKVW